MFVTINNLHQISLGSKICVVKQNSMIQSLRTQKGLSEKDKQATTALTSLKTADAFYLFCFGLLEGKLDGGHSQLVGKEAHVSGQLW